MKATIRDLSKMSSKSVNVVKTFLYYGFIPSIVYMGAKTIQWEQFLGPQQ
jgi:hypothetical protein